MKPKPGAAPDPIDAGETPQSPRASARLWIVVTEDRQHLLVKKEPLEGWEKWSFGQRVTILEYTFSKVIYKKP